MVNNQFRGGDFAGHPKGLYILFATEMWERFSFYGMRAILVYYMMKQLLFTQDKASYIYGLYTGFVYFTPFFGGIMADRWFGQRKMVVAGGLIMALGQFCMVFESLFYPALLLIIIGNGALKPNISTQVGALYAAHDHRRDRAFNIFYLGINVGAFLSPLICGTLGEIYGWRYGFSAAGVGMLLGLGIYMWGQKYLAADAIMRGKDEKVKHPPLTAEEKKRIWALIILCALNVIFWIPYEQEGNTLSLWADAYTNRAIFGGWWEIPASWFQSVNSAVIFIMTPVLCAFWAWQSKKGSEPSSIAKMGIGCIFLAVCFVPMVFAAKLAERTGTVGPWYIISCISMMAVGELYLSPIGLSLVTKLAPPRMVSMMMGVWFMSYFAGNYISGLVGGLWTKIPKGDFFMLQIGIAAVAGALIFASIKPVHRAIGNIDD